MKSKFKTYGFFPSIFLAVSLRLFPVAHADEGRMRFNIDPGWRYQPGSISDDAFQIGYGDAKWDLVSLPHSDGLFTANLGGFREHGRDVGWYRRQLDVPKEWLEKKLFLEVQGAMQATSLWVNGKKVGDYAVSGYDSFDFDVTSFIKAGKNIIAVEVDNRVNSDIPPDGQLADYVLFGGLYRDVFLHVTDPIHLTFPWETRQAGVSFTLPEISKQQAALQAESTVRNESAQNCKCTLTTEVYDRDGKMVARMQTENDIPSGKESTFEQKSAPILDPHLWSPDDPYLYKIVTSVREGDRELDRIETPFGFRWVKFDKFRGFFLNGKPLKLIGANYHQSWPFIGNAVPRGLQRRDAEQMKAMGINWVRLSHYPHSPALLDAFDELGLMALEEPPTWSDQGNAKWMENLEASERSMIRRDRNHPCVIIWHPAINHHLGNPRLIQAAIEEDPTRDRGGDTVMTPMDFQPLMVSGYGALSVEHTGHIFPAARGSRDMIFSLGNGVNRTYNTKNREFDQARLHWEQVNAAYAKEDNAGLAVWCMYDYNTMYNTNEPGMVWHGVFDLFRIPKFSYWWHQSELTTNPMVYVVRVDKTNAAVFSNCEQVRLWQDTGLGYQELETRNPEAGFAPVPEHTIKYRLKHPPFQFTVLTNAIKLKAEGLTAGKVLAANEWKDYGLPVALTLVADRPTITADGADLSRIIVSAVDANGTPVDNCDVSVAFDIKGIGQLIGENPVKLRAGKMIILAQSGFVPDELKINASSKDLQSADVTIRTEHVPEGVDMPKDLPAKQPTKRQVITSDQMPIERINGK